MKEKDYTLSVDVTVSTYNNNRCKKKLFPEDLRKFNNFLYAINPQKQGINRLSHFQ